ncbi:hypothetical protein GF406_19520 [candidate division KSB1 bacterium]|nr:hypothetical protein [candidate division KSB1 bacterium]
MIHRDYIMRMIEQLSVVLMKILFNKQSKNYDRALFEIDNAYFTILEMDPLKIKHMSEQELVELLNLDQGFEAERAVVIAELLREEAEINELQSGFDNEVLELFKKSFCLYIEAIQTNKDFESYMQTVNGIVLKIADYDSSDVVKYRLFRYYELTGRLDQAENILYELIESGYPDIRQIGQRFYQRLLEKPDSELRQGNFTREEVEEGLSELESFTRPPGE